MIIMTTFTRSPLSVLIKTEVLRLTNYNNFSKEWSGCDWLDLELRFLFNLIKGAV